MHHIHERWTTNPGAHAAGHAGRARPDTPSAYQRLEGRRPRHACRGVPCPILFTAEADNSLMSATNVYTPPASLSWARGQSKNEIRQ